MPELTLVIDLGTEGEVVGDAEGDCGWGEALIAGDGPVLGAIVGFEADGGGEVDVEAAAVGVDDGVVALIAVGVGEVEVEGARAGEAGGVGVEVVEEFVFNVKAEEVGVLADGRAGGGGDAGFGGGVDVEMVEVVGDLKAAGDAVVAVERRGVGGVGVDVAAEGEDVEGFAEGGLGLGVEEACGDERDHEKNGRK